MKQALVLTALALASAAACAQSAVTINGVMDAAARVVRNDGAGSDKSIVSGASQTSRLVVRGVEDLGSGLSAGFWLEHGLSVDTGAPTGAFWDRRSTVSLISKSLGEVRIGRDFVPTYVNWSRFDPFQHVGVAASANSYNGTPLGPIRNAFGTGANTTVRSSNAVQYILPNTLGGLEGGLMVAPTENLAKVYAGRLGYTFGPVLVSAAHTVTETALTAVTGKVKDTDLGATYTVGPAKVSAVVRQFKQASAKQTNTMLSTVVLVGSGEIKASYIRMNMSGTVGATSIAANDGQQIGLGYVHNLSKRTALYTHAARISNDGVATFVIPGGPAGLTPGGKSTGYEAGIRHLF